MHNSHQRVAKHFFLPKGEENQISPTLRWIVAKVFGFAEQYIAADDADVFGKEPDGESGKGNKKYLLYDLHDRNCTAKVLVFLTTASTD